MKVDCAAVCSAVANTVIDAIAMSDADSGRLNITEAMKLERETSTSDRRNPAAISNIRPAFIISNVSSSFFLGS